MPTFDELLAQSSQLGQGPSPEPAGFLGGLADFGQGALFDTLDVLDRPGRFVRNLLAGNVGDAFEALDPFNLITEAESTPFTGGQLLESFGVGEGPEAAFGLSFRDAAGLGAEIFTDPLTFFGGAIGRLVGRGASGAAKGLTRFSEGLAGQTAGRLGGGAAGALGTKLGGFLEKAPLGAVGAIGGATAGALGAEEGQAFGGALLGGAIGGLGGVGAANLGRAADVGLAAGDLLSNTFRIGRREGLTRAETFLSTARRIAAKQEASVGSALRAVEKQHELLTEAVETSAGKWKSINPDVGVIDSIEKAEAELLRLGEQLGFGERVADRAGKLKTTTLGGGNVPIEAFEEGAEELAGRFGVFTESAKDFGARVKREQGVLKRGGQSRTTQFNKQIDNLPPQARQVAENYFAGDDAFKFLNKGKLRMDALQVERGILERGALDSFMARHGVAHLAHVKGSTSLDEITNSLIGQLNELGGDVAGAKDLTEKLRLARGVAAGTRRGVVARRLAGTVDEINQKFPGLLDESFSKLSAVDANRVATRLTASDMVKYIATDSEWSKPLSELTEIEKATGLWRDLAKDPLARSALPPEMLKAFKGRAVNATVHRELFHPKFGVAKKMLDPDMPSKLKRAWQQMNKTWVGWTLGPFAGWWSRNLVGNVWNSWLAGGLGKWNESKVLQNAISDVMNGRLDDIAGSISVGGKKLSGAKLAQFAEEAIKDGVVGTGFTATEAGRSFLRHLSGRDLIKAGAKTAKSKLKAARDLFRFDPQQNLFVRTGFGLNGVLEDYSRIQHYLVKRAGHANPTSQAARVAASDSMVKALGDFRNLSPGDEALKQVMPFWSWTRFNVPRQVRAFAEAPQKVVQVGRIKINLDEKNRARVPDELIPEWLQGQLAVPIANRDGVLSFFSFNRWLPLADLTEIDSPKKFGAYIINSLSPLIGEPLEQTLNLDTFFQRSIENYPGEQEQLFGIPVDRRSVHLLRNARILSEMDRVWGPLTGLTPASERLQEELAVSSTFGLAARAAVGLKERNVDLRQQKIRRVKSLKSEIGKIKSRIRKARAKNEDETVLRQLLANRQGQLRMVGAFQMERHPLF